MAYPPYGARYPQPAATKTNGLAIGSLVSGIVAWVAVPFVGALVAIVLGHLALKQIKQTGEEGSGMAIAGLVLGYLNVVASIVVACFFGTLVLGCFAAAFNLDSVTTTPTPTPTEDPFTRSPTPEPLPS